MKEDKRRIRFEGISAYVKSMLNLAESNEQTLVDADTLTKQTMRHMDYEHLSKDELTETLVGYGVESILNQCGYRSVVHGKKIFVKAESCTNPVIASHLLENAKLQAVQADTVVQRLGRFFQRKTCDGQMGFIWDSDGNADALVELNDEELVAVLKDCIICGDTSAIALERRIERARHEKQQRLSKQA